MPRLSLFVLQLYYFLEPLGRRNPQIAHIVNILMSRLKSVQIATHTSILVHVKKLTKGAKNGGIFMMDEPQIFTLNFLNTSSREVNES